jgi:2-methylcitrate dehydratase PrpD
MTSAAFVNGFQITAFTMCDVYRPALCHVTPEVVPAVLAVAERDGVPGTTVLAALAVGLEVTTRLGLGIDYPRFRANGWHAPGVIGTIGAAAAAARVLGLDDRRTRQAMGLGVSQAAGTFAAIGTPAVKFHQARGAVSGLWAASFAANGIGGSERALTHPDGGLFETYAGGGRPDRVLDRLGEEWQLEQISLRRWPAASSLQSLVDCMLVAEAHGLDGVESVEVTLPQASYDLCAARGWDDQLSAMQSARYVAAVVLRDGQCWIDQFTNRRRADHAIDGFARNRVTVHCDPDLPTAGSAGAGTPARCDAGPALRHRARRPGPPPDPRRSARQARVGRH